MTYYVGNNFGSREERRENLLLSFGLLCSCSECSLEGGDLVENERLRAEIREKWEELKEMLYYEDVETDQIGKEEAERLVSLNHDLRVLTDQLGDERLLPKLIVNV